MTICSFCILTSCSNNEDSEFSQNSDVFVQKDVDGLQMFKASVDGCLFEALGINMIDIGYTLVLMGRAGYITKTGLKRLIRKVLKDVAKNVVEVAAWGSVALAYKIGVFMYCYFDKTDSSINFVRNNINLSETNVIGLWNIHLFSQKQIA